MSDAAHRHARAPAVPLGEGRRHRHPATAASGASPARSPGGACTHTSAGPTCSCPRWSSRSCSWRASRAASRRSARSGLSLPRRLHRLSVRVRAVPVGDVRGLFTGFTLAFDFESGFARRLMLAAEDRRGIALGYALVALSRAAITLTVVTGVALIAGMQDHRRRRGHVRSVRPCAAARARRLRLGGGRRVPLPLDPGGPADADAGLPDPVPGARVRAAGLLKGWIHAVASVNPATAFLDAGRGLISGVHDHTGLAFVCALALIVLFAVWTLTGLRAAERST